MLGAGSDAPDDKFRARGPTSVSACEGRGLGAGPAPVSVTVLGGKW